MLLSILSLLLVSVLLTSLIFTTRTGLSIATYGVSYFSPVPIQFEGVHATLIGTFEIDNIPVVF